MLGLSSAELTANWGQWWWWCFNGKARLAASFGGPVVFLLNKYVVFVHLIDAGQDAAYVIVLSSIAATCLLWIAVALCTKPEPEEKLLAFYKEARPMGWWGPIAHKAGVETGGDAPRPRALRSALRSFPRFWPCQSLRCGRVDLKFHIVLTIVVRVSERFFGSVAHRLLGDDLAHRLFPWFLRIVRVRSERRNRCLPWSSKLSGANQVRKAFSSSGHSASMAAYHAVSRLRPL